jgi:hypothetical protein
VKEVTVLSSDTAIKATASSWLYVAVTEGASMEASVPTFVAPLS